MVTFKFVLRPSSKAGRHPGSLSLRIIYDRKPKTVSISCRLFPEEWDAEMQTVLCSTVNPARKEYLLYVRQQVMTCTNKMNDIILKMEKEGSYTVNDLIACYRKAVNNCKLQDYAGTLASEMRENKQFRTAKAYETVSRGFVAFNKGTDIPLKQINAGLVKRFETFLKENGKRPNTVSYYMRNLRAIYNKACEAGYISKNEKTFTGVFMGVEETKKRALNADEMNLLINIDFEKLLRQCQHDTPEHRYICNLHHAWRLFFFCLYAQGMCFVDMAYLKKSYIREGVIRYYRKKTGRQIEVPVNEGMQKIIESFEDKTTDSEYLIPVSGKTDRYGPGWYETAMRTQNRRLKKLAVLAGLDKGISTHVARHSWATICKNELLPLSVISEGLGHSSEKMTRKYLASFDLSILGKAGKTVLTAITRSSQTTSLHPIIS